MTSLVSNIHAAVCEGVCENGGKCLTPNANCSCLSGYSGEHCEISKSDSLQMLQQYITPTYIGHLYYVSGVSAAAAIVIVAIVLCVVIISAAGNSKKKSRKRYLE